MSVEGAPARILLVEDNADDAVLARRALARCGLPVSLEVAADGMAALDLLTGTPPHAIPDLVILDLKLPRLGGLDLLARLRAAPATNLLPIVVLTTSLEDRDVREAYRRGANSYLRKPVSFDEFTEMVRHLVHYWVVLNRPPPAPEVPTR